MTGISNCPYLIRRPEPQVRHLADKYGLTYSRAAHNRSTLQRMDAMKPEARAYMLKLIAERKW